MRIVPNDVRSERRTRGYWLEVLDALLDDNTVEIECSVGHAQSSLDSALKQLNRRSEFRIRTKAGSTANSRYVWLEASE